MAYPTRRRANKPLGGTTHFEPSRTKSIRALATDVGSVVYAARLDDGTIKIGYSTNIYNRMQQLGGMSKILAIRPGGLAEEQAIHRTLVAHRAHGKEYYHAVPEVLAVVNEMRAAYGMPALQN